MNRMVQRARDEESGFTLIELMIVIVILGVLAGIVIFAVGGITDNGNVAACKSDVKTISVAVEAYKAKHGGYPGDLEPTLTQDPDKFLRPQTGLAGDALQNTSGGYTVNYAPATGDITVTPANFC